MAKVRNSGIEYESTVARGREETSNRRAEDEATGPEPREEADKEADKEPEEDVEMREDSTGPANDGDGEETSNRRAVDEATGPEPREEADKEPEEDVEMREDSNDGEEVQEVEDSVDDSQPMRPVKLYFGPTEYRKTCKIGSRCSVLHVVEVIETLSEEVNWFRSHPQFKHIFHMAKEPNHMNQSLWMLLLHTASSEKQSECWFVVNGVPIRYSLREHTLLSGLDCHDYPNDYKNLGSLKFVERMFGRTKLIKVSDVEAQLTSMKESSIDRKKIALLFFLSKVLKAKSKSDCNIDPFLLRLVGDLKLCKKFPWGRYTFDDTMMEIRRVMKKFEGRVKPKGVACSFAGFLLPLQILAFECIPNLGRKFGVAVTAEKYCPRMCKHKFSEICMKGIPLDDINEAIGSSSEDICSILEPDSDEEDLMVRILDPGFDDGIGMRDDFVEGWMDHLTVKKKKIFWKDLYELDIASRVNVPTEETPIASASASASNTSLLDLQASMENDFKEILEKLGHMDERVKVLEELVLPPASSSPPPPHSSPPLQHSSPPPPEHSSPQPPHSSPPLRHSSPPPPKHSSPPLQHSSPPPPEHFSPPLQHSSPPLQHSSPQPLEHSYPPPIERPLNSVRRRNGQSFKCTARKNVAPKMIDALIREKSRAKRKREKSKYLSSPYGAENQAKKGKTIQEGEEKQSKKTRKK